MHRKKNKNQAGYSLIELMMVVAIISLLSSVFFVSAAKARQRAKNVRILGDIKQLASALELYSLKNGDYPLTTDASGALTIGWDISTNADFIQPLVRDKIMAQRLTNTSSFGDFYFNYSQFAGSAFGQTIAYGSTTYGEAFRNICGPKAKAGLFFGFDVPVENGSNVLTIRGYTDPQFKICNYDYAGISWGNCYCFE